MASIDRVAELLEAFAPTTLAEDWDNVGLLLGDRSRPCDRVMTCLTLSEDVATEAIDKGAQLVVTHHPLPFRPLSTLTTDTTAGRIVWRLAGAGVAVYSPHTAFDSAAEGINQQLADGLNLAEAHPLVPADPNDPNPLVGAGRCGSVLEPTTLDLLADHAMSLLSINQVQLVGQDDQPINRVAVACGSGGSFLDAAIEAGADALVTGEATFHALLAARAAGVAMVLTGHYASERFAVERLARWIGQQRLGDPTAGVEAWASEVESDPLRLVTK